MGGCRLTDQSDYVANILVMLYLDRIRLIGQLTGACQYVSAGTLNGQSRAKDISR